RLQGRYPGVLCLAAQRAALLLHEVRRPVERLPRTQGPGERADPAPVLDPAQGGLRDPAGRGIQGEVGRGRPVPARLTQWVTAGCLLREHLRSQVAAEVLDGIDLPARGDPGASLPDLDPAGAHRPATLSALWRVHGLYRGLGSLLRVA